MLFSLYQTFAGTPDMNELKDVSFWLGNNQNTQSALFKGLQDWWIQNIYSYHGSIAFILLLFLTIIMFVPVAAVFLSIGVFISFSSILFYSVIIDVCLYLLIALFKKSLIAQVFDRYYRVFPNRGKEHYEKSYEKWLRNHHEEFERDNKVAHRSDDDPYYEEDDDESDYEYEDYENEDTFEYTEDEDSVDYEDWNDDEDDDDLECYEEDDDDEFYYEDSDDEYDDTSIPVKSSSSFDFFAGCNSRESIDKKYKSLVKLYHPDNMDGDTAALQEINVQYDQAKRRFA